MNNAAAALSHLIARSDRVLCGNVLVLGAQAEDWVGLDRLLVHAKPLWVAPRRSDALFCTHRDIAFARDLTHVPERTAFDGAVVFASQSKPHCLGHLAIAAANVKTGGAVFFVGAKEFGSASLLHRALAAFEI